MPHKAPGRSDREGITLMQLADMFPTEEAARKWFESRIWPDGRHCSHCGSTRTHDADGGNRMPYRCSDCREYFSVKTGTLMHNSRLPLRKWAFAIYLYLTSLKAVSSMKLHRDVGVSQKTAWFMLQRIRKAFEGDDKPPFDGPVEVDKAYFGGKRKNMSNAKRKELAGTGRGAVGKTAVVGAKDRKTNKVRAKVVENTDKPTLQAFVGENAAPGATVYTDEAAAYQGMPFDHEAVNHTVSEYVRGMAHTNGMKSFWATLCRAYMGTFHKISAKHLHRYVTDFAGRHGVRDMDTIGQMRHIAQAMAGKRLAYRELVTN